MIISKEHKDAIVKENERRINNMKLTIEANITEQDFMESMLNQISSGMQISFIFLMYALAHSWHIDKLIYYKNLLESAEDERLEK